MQFEIRRFRVPPLIVLALVTFVNAQTIHSGNQKTKNNEIDSELQQRRATADA